MDVAEKGWFSSGTWRLFEHTDKPHGAVGVSVPCACCKPSHACGSPMLLGLGSPQFTISYCEQSVLSLMSHMLRSTTRNNLRLERAEIAGRSWITFGASSRTSVSRLGDKGFGMAVTLALPHLQAI